MRPCFVFNAAEADKPAVLSLLDDIGLWGIQAKDFKASLDAVTSASLTVEINSPGGDVFAGLAMFNMLKGSGKEINVKVLGVAASAASLIAMAGDSIEMPKNTFMMIHNPWAFAMGNADDLREQANVLDKIGTSLLNTYAARTGLSEDELKPMLATDTWFTADEALEKGFATKVTDGIEAKAKFDMDKAELPDNVRAIFAKAKEVKPAPAPAPVPSTPVAKDVHAYATANGLTEYADLLAVQCGSMDDVKARVSTIGEIKALCAYAKAEPADFIKAGKTLAETRTDLVKALAEKDQHVDTTKPEPKPKTPRAKTADAIYAERNARKSGNGRK